MFNTETNLNFKKILVIFGVDLISASRCLSPKVSVSILYYNILVLAGAIRKEWLCFTALLYGGESRLRNGSVFYLFMLEKCERLRQSAGRHREKTGLEGKATASSFHSITSFGGAGQSEEVSLSSFRSTSSASCADLMRMCRTRSRPACF